MLRLHVSDLRTQTEDLWLAYLPLLNRVQGSLIFGKGKSVCQLVGEVE